MEASIDIGLCPPVQVRGKETGPTGKKIALSKKHFSAYFNPPSSCGYKNENFNGIICDAVRSNDWF
jgi:hypothetical protein